MENLSIFIIPFLSLVLGGLAGYVATYLRKKGENRATFEDSAAITRIAEEIKSGFATQLESTKSLFANELEGIKYQLTLAADASRRYEDLKASAYVDFCKAIAAIAISQRYKNKDREFEATIALADVKARIAIYGSPEVASALGVFFKEHGQLSSPEAITCFIGAMELMRNQTVGEDGSVPMNVLSQLFFSDDLPSLPPRYRSTEFTN
jgi:hypothetical protein